MSALPSTTDIHQGDGYVSFVPISDIALSVPHESKLVLRRDQEECPNFSWRIALIQIKELPSFSFIIFLTEINGGVDVI